MLLHKKNVEYQFNNNTKYSNNSHIMLNSFGYVKNSIQYILQHILMF